MPPEDKLAHVRLKVIPEPDEGTRAVFITDQTGEDFVLFRGEAAPLAMDCGKCGRTLTLGVARNQLRNVVIRCPRCGSFNDTE